MASNILLGGHCTPQLHQPSMKTVFQMSTMSPFQKDIDQLQFYLEHIPGAFVYSPAFGSEIKDFQLDADWIADIGEEGAVNQELKIPCRRTNPTKRKRTLP